MLVWYSKSMKLNNIIDRIKLPFRKEKELFSSLYAILGFYPHNIEYYKMALIHKSIRKRNDKGKPLNNERLEFLGDAILDAAVGYGDANLSGRSVSQQMCGDIAEDRF